MVYYNTPYPSEIQLGLAATWFTCLWLGFRYLLISVWTRRSLGSLSIPLSFPTAMAMVVVVLLAFPAVICVRLVRGGVGIGVG
jgi:hypothetical protein